MIWHDVALDAGRVAVSSACACVREPRARTRSARPGAPLPPSLNGYDIVTFVSKLSERVTPGRRLPYARAPAKRAFVPGRGA